MTQDNPRMGDLNELVERLQMRQLAILGLANLTPRRKDDAALFGRAAAALTSLIAERDGLREANRGLHRRAQAHESEQAAFLRETGYHEQKRVADMWSAQWKSEFDRLIRGHQEVKQIYEICAKALGLPYGLYKYVGDLPHGRPRTEQGLWANVLLSRQGGIEVYNVREVVQRLADELASARAALSLDTNKGDDGTKPS